MGLRSSRHVFVPKLYVFPGGRVDPGDARVPAPFALQGQTQERLCHRVTPARGRAIAMAAVRETFEETGLQLGREISRPLRTRSLAWQPFYHLCMAPALDRMHYFARAVTPPNNVRRFDARFFLADAGDCRGELRGNGELEDLHWVSFDETARLPMLDITRLVLSLVQNAFGHPVAVDIPRQVRERELVEQYHLKPAQPANPSG